MAGITVRFNQETQTNQGSSLIWRLLLAAIFSVVAVGASAAGWGVLAYFTGKVYFIIAILIGMVVTFAITYPFERVSLPLAAILFFPAAFLTIFAVLVGDAIFYLLTGMFKYNLVVMDAIRAVTSQPLDFLQESLGSIVLAAIGTVLGFVNAIRR